MKRMERIGVLWLAMSLIGTLLPDGAASKPKECEEFAEQRMTLERNETDGDTEVVLFAQGQDDGLSRLTITAPDGRKTAKVTADKNGIGMREFLLESAEPPDLERVLASFPEGVYQLRGTTVAGDCLRGSVALSHDIAPATELLTPAEESVVPIDQVVLSWTAVPAATLYIVELQNEELGNEHTFQLLPPTTSIAIPAALLVPDSPYQFGVAVQAADGNITAVESTFSTAP